MPRPTGSDALRRPAQQVPADVTTMAPPPRPSMAALRLRLAFEYPPPLLPAARLCWLLLPAEQCRVVADLESIIRRRLGFGRRARLHLYLDGALLPPNESALLVRDNDCLRVKQEELTDGLGDGVDGLPESCRKRERPALSEGRERKKRRTVGVQCEEQRMPCSVDQCTASSEEQDVPCSNGAVFPADAVRSRKRKTAPEVEVEVKCSARKTQKLKKKKDKFSKEQERTEPSSKGAVVSRSSQGVQHSSRSKCNDAESDSESPSGEAGGCQQLTNGERGHCGVDGEREAQHNDAAPCSDREKGAQRNTAAPCSNKERKAQRNTATSNVRERRVQSDVAAPCSDRERGVQRNTAAPCSDRERGVQRNTAAPSSDRERGVQRNTAAPCSNRERGVQRNTAAPCSDRERGVQRNTAAPCSDGESVQQAGAAAEGLSTPLDPAPAAAAPRCSPGGARGDGWEGPDGGRCGGRSDAHGRLPVLPPTPACAMVRGYGRGRGRGISNWDWQHHGHFRGRGQGAPPPINGWPKPGEWQDPTAGPRETTERAPGPLHRDYSTLPLLAAPPQLGERIAFKVLELSDNYTPEMSDYKEGRVVRWDAATGEVELSLDTQPPETSKEPGKFDLIYQSETGEAVVEYAVTREPQMTRAWSSLVEPRLMVTHTEAGLTLPAC
ncbi:coilin isoform X2 [Amblyraja radiata]|uniref:coilin isoform X2 n=1 Tax=Amblyraja radiata TaxID=386614 RepID=UPI0014035EF8|nr:coilin isoform X2 [Amblyraja radiata]